MSDSPLKFWMEKDGRLLRMQLARPKANIIDAEMISALDEVLSTHESSPTLAAVLLSHEGPHFSFGASVEEHLPDQCEAMLRGLHTLIRRMLNFPVPILVAVRGQCLGGGLEVACAGSQIFAANDARFGQPEIKLATFAPAASCLLPIRIGQAPAEEMLFSGRSLNADEALSLHLVCSLADDPEVAAVTWFEEHLQELSSAALRYAVRAVRQPYIDTASSRLDEVETLCVEMIKGSEDTLEGLNAFIEKRRPQWVHR